MNIIYTYSKIYIIYNSISDEYVSPLQQDIYSIWQWICMTERMASSLVCYVWQDLAFTLLKQEHNSGVESLWLLYQQACMPRSLSHLVRQWLLYRIYLSIQYRQARMTWSVSHIIFGGVYHPSDADRQALKEIGLKQVVQAATRKSAIPDKTYTHIGQWYGIWNQEYYRILQSLTTGRAVFMLPTDGSTRPTGHRIMATAQSNNSNSKAQLEWQLAASNWSELHNFILYDSGSGSQRMLVFGQIQTKSIGSISWLVSLNAAPLAAGRHRH